MFLWNKTASLRDIEVKYRPEPSSVCFIPRVRLQFRKPEPRIRRLSGRQFLDVSVMQELAIMRRLTTAVLLIAASDLRFLGFLIPLRIPTEERFVLNCFALTL
jgi:hypothetical protein